MNITVPEITTAGRRRVTAAKDRAPFKIDGETYTLLRPKKLTLANAAMALDNGTPLDDPKNLKLLLGFTAQMLDWIDDEPADTKGLHGKALIEKRLSDPHDALDLDDLVPIIVIILDGWFARPTSAPRGSSPQRRKAPAARASRARTR